MKYIPFAGKIFLTLLLNVLAVLAADRLVRTAHRHEYADKKGVNPPAAVVY